MSKQYEYTIKDQDAVDVEAISNIIKEHGFCIIHNFSIEGADIGEIEKETLQAFKQVGTKYEFGDNLRMQKGVYKKFSNMNTYFNNSFFKNIVDSYSGNYKSFNDHCPK